MFGKAAAILVLSLIWYFISEYRIWLDLDKVLYSKSPGSCRTLLKGGGSEDFAELDEDTLLVSSGLNWQGRPGKIYALKTDGAVDEVQVVNTVSKENPLLAPHGLSVWTDPETGVTFLYVIIHTATKEGVAVFEVKKSPLTLNYVKTITDPEFFGFMNDLVVVGKDQFYITQSIRSRNWNLIPIELGLGLPTGKLAYYDGKSARPVLKGLFNGNGINISPDKRTLYVSEFSQKRIHALNIESNGEVETLWIHQLGSGVDNIQVDDVTGDLWVAAFPFMQRAVDIFGVLGHKPQVAQVLRMRMKDNQVYDVEEIYANNGSVVSGASVALYKNNKLFIGTVSAQLVMCDVHYLSP